VRDRSPAKFTVPPTIVALLAPGAPPDHPDRARGGIEEGERLGTSNSALSRRVHRSAVVVITRIAVSRYVFVHCSKSLVHGVGCFGRKLGGWDRELMGSGNGAVA
jgi:hypothetical protein